MGSAAGKKASAPASLTAPKAGSAADAARRAVWAHREEQARLVADALGIEQVQADDAIAYPLVAVIGDDLGEELVGAGQEQSSAQGAAELPQEGTGAQALAADPAEALR